MSGACRCIRDKAPPYRWRAASILCKCGIVFALLLIVLLYLQQQLQEQQQTYYTYAKWSIQGVSNDTGRNQSSAYTSPPAVVLFWNPMFSDKRWTLPVDTLHVSCPHTRCVITNRRHYLPTPDAYAAIVFHMAREFSVFTPLPARRDPRQWYIFALLESPDHTEHSLRARRGFFNLTMSYRLDADIVWSYNRVTDKRSNVTVAPAQQPAWHHIDAAWTQKDIALLARIGRKRKLVAWFVSNCAVKSAREKLARKLQAHLPVDIYGHCGKLDCEYGSAECNALLDNDYKFYLSFENSLCIDYVTEKLYNALQRQLVPVVYGGANYTRFAPPHSYIDAQAFPNVTALAAYLLHLHRTPREYAKYFWWRRYYSITGDGLQVLPVCELCERISAPETLRHPQVYDDIEHYWQYNACTSEPTIKF